MSLRLGPWFKCYFKHLFHFFCSYLPIQAFTVNSFVTFMLSSVCRYASVILLWFVSISVPWLKLWCGVVLATAVLMMASIVSCWLTDNARCCGLHLPLLGPSAAGLCLALTRCRYVEFTQRQRHNIGSKSFMYLLSPRHGIACSLYTTSVY